MAYPKIKKITKVKTKPKTTEPSFRTAFSSAKKSGKKTFNWNGKKYTTQTAEEKATSLKNKGGKPGKKFLDAANISYYNEYVAKGGTGKPAGKDLQKSTTEISNSYDNVALNGIEGRKKTKYGRRN
jgi:hypothetical protein|tara:strand:+ start:292 stop:669 length:378 start_codon:yes stop_codon:yes gene_type:complete